jgi:hypothetical protein
VLSSAINHLKTAIDALPNVTLVTLALKKAICEKTLSVDHHVIKDYYERIARIANLKEKELLRELLILQLD